MPIASSRIRTSTGYTVYDYLGPIADVQEEIETLFRTYPPATHGTEITRDETSDTGRRVTIWRHDG